VRSHETCKNQSVCEWLITTAANLHDMVPLRYRSVREQSEVFQTYLPSRIDMCACQGLLSASPSRMGKAKSRYHLLRCPVAFLPFHCGKNSGEYCVCPLQPAVFRKIATRLVVALAFASFSVCEIRHRSYSKPGQRRKWRQPFETVGQYMWSKTIHVVTNLSFRIGWTKSRAFFLLRRRS